MGVTNTLSKLKEYFEAWHNANYDRLHSSSITDGLQTQINNLIRRVDNEDDAIDDINDRLDGLDAQITSANHHHPATNIDFSIQNKEEWQLIYNPEKPTVQGALDELLIHVNNTFTSLLEVNNAKMTIFNPAITWNRNAYAYFTKLGGIGICEYWIRSDSKIPDANVEYEFGVIPEGFVPKSTKYQDTHSYAVSPNDFGIRVILSSGGKIKINCTKAAKVNSIGCIVYVMDDEVYGNMERDEIDE